MGLRLITKSIMKCIELTQGRVAVVDDDDFERLAQWRWQYDCGYASRRERITPYGTARKYRKIYMHREILNPPKGMDTDHENGNRLDNRRANLRLATRAENLRNRGSNKNNELAVKGAY